MGKRSFGFLAAAILALPVSANATVIFSDNFDGENGGVGALNYAGFLNWTVMDGTVDLIGNGFYDFLPGNGLYVDLDGSSRDAGIMGSMQWLAPGAYTLFFDLAGNQNRDTEEMTTANVAIILGGGSGANATYSLPQTTGFTTYSLNFDISELMNPSAIYITFGASGGDNVGMLLDNVSIAHRVPEPGTLALLGLGLVGMGVRRRNKRA